MYFSGEQNTEILKILISHAAIKHVIKEDKMWRDIVRQVLENENGFYEDDFGYRYINGTRYNILNVNAFTISHYYATDVTGTIPKILEALIASSPNVS